MKEASAKVRVVPELVAQNPEGARRVAEAAGNFGGREAVDEVAAKSFVLALKRRFRSQEELGRLARC